MYTATLVSPPPPQRIVVANRADGGLFYWLGKLYGFAVLLILWAIAISGVSCYAHFARETPSPPDLSRYASVAPGVTRVYAGDGTLLGEFAAEWREVVPYERIPKMLIDAVVATEDHDFFDHNGIYFRGILRAAWANVTAGDFEQGGSTITQQVAKQFLGNEKSLARKAREAILARRLEAKYSKRAILSVYLNQIFLGNGAYGVAAAARRYFDKRIDQLTLPEAALIAGLAQAPSRYDPLRHPALAKERRDTVIDKMVRFGRLDAAAGDKAKATPLEVNPPPDVFPNVLPYYTEHVRRYLVDSDDYGPKALLEDGLTVDTAVQPVVDSAAYETVDFGARKQDKRQGWRGPEAYLEGHARDVFLERAAKMYGAAPLQDERRYLALVTNVTSRHATVEVGAVDYDLPLRNADWASKWSPTDAVNDVLITDLREALRVGDVVWVSREPHVRGRFRDWHIPDGHNPHWLPPRTEEQMRHSHRDLDHAVMLDQVPHPESAMFTADHTTGYVLSMVGGYDYRRSQYNRAFQACRQPGSTYKPIYYSAALDKGYGFDTLLADKPIQVVDPVTGEVWMPTNFGGALENQVTLEYALVFSKNLPSVSLFTKVGAENVKKWARRLGFTTKIIADKALALGASCTVMPELTHAFAIFARNGKEIHWVYVRRVLDRDGVVLEDNTVPYDPMLPPPDALDRIAATAGDEPAQAIPARSAFLTSKLLRQEVRHGFASVVRATDVKGAGKTGTSSATMDTTYVSYTSRWIATVWMGDDIRQRPLGKDDAAYMTVVPMWARFMADQTWDHPNLDIPWKVPRGVNPKDRGAHTLGETGEPSDLVYRHAAKPTDDGGATNPEAGG